MSKLTTRIERFAMTAGLALVVGLGGCASPTGVHDNDGVAIEDSATGEGSEAGEGSAADEAGKAAFTPPAYLKAPCTELWKNHLFKNTGGWTKNGRCTNSLPNNAQLQLTYKQVKAAYCDKRRSESERIGCARKAAASAVITALRLRHGIKIHHNLRARKTHPSAYAGLSHGVFRTPCPNGDRTCTDEFYRRRRARVLQFGEGIAAVVATITEVIELAEGAAGVAEAVDLGAEVVVVEDTEAVEVASEVETEYATNVWVGAYNGANVYAVAYYTDATFAAAAAR